MPKRRRTDFNRVSAQLGAIRIRTQYTPRRGRGHAPKHQLRWIKVANEGPQDKRWKPYARWWWETNRGPVPEGLRVCHLDGNTLNDRPENYGLLNGGELIQLYHRVRPEVAQLNRRRCREATSAANVVRGMAGRAARWLGSRWYAVDVERREILVYATRSRRQLVTLLGGRASINGHVTRRPPYLLVRGSALPGPYEGFARIVPEYRPWRRGLQDLDGVHVLAGATS